MPTGSDVPDASGVFETLASLTQEGKTVIYVTHDPNLAARAQARAALGGVLLPRGGRRGRAGVRFGRLRGLSSLETQI